MKEMSISHNVVNDGEIVINLYTSAIDDPSPRLLVIKANADGMSLEFFENAERTYDATCSYEEWFEFAKRSI